MNKVILIGRLTKDPEVRYSAGENASAVARYYLAVDRRYHRDGDPSADFINCVTFGKNAEFVEKYLKKGMKIAVTGRIQTRNYTNQEGKTVYVTEVVVEEHEFAESKNATSNATPAASAPAPAVPTPTVPTPAVPASRAPSRADGYMNIPDGLDEELPFN